MSHGVTAAYWPMPGQAPECCAAAHLYVKLPQLHHTLLLKVLDHILWLLPVRNAGQCSISDSTTASKQAPGMNSYCILLSSSVEQVVYSCSVIQEKHALTWHTTMY